MKIILYIIGVAVGVLIADYIVENFITYRDEVCPGARQIAQKFLKMWIMFVQNATSNLC